MHYLYSSFIICLVLYRLDSFHYYRDNIFPLLDSFFIIWVKIERKCRGFSCRMWTERIFCNNFSHFKYDIYGYRSLRINSDYSINYSPILLSVKELLSAQTIPNNKSLLLRNNEIHEPDCLWWYVFISHKRNIETIIFAVGSTTVRDAFRARVVYVRSTYFETRPWIFNKFGPRDSSSNTDVFPPACAHYSSLCCSVI